MTDFVVENLIIDMLDWLIKAERTYDEVIDVWRTSCPKLQVWEDANDRSLVVSEIVNGRCIVNVTASGLALLDSRQHQSKRKKNQPD